MSQSTFVDKEVILQLDSNQITIIRDWLENKQQKHGWHRTSNDEQYNLLGMKIGTYESSVFDVYGKRTCNIIHVYHLTDDEVEAFIEEFNTHLKDSPNLYKWDRTDGTVHCIHKATGISTKTSLQIFVDIRLFKDIVQ